MACKSVLKMSLDHSKIKAETSIRRNTLFPVFLKPEHLHTLIIGGGNVGLEKLTALLSNAPKAQVTLVSKKIKPEIRKLAAEAPNVRMMEKSFSTCDLYGMDLAIAATGHAEQNLQIYHAAKAMRVLINVADTPDLCDFYLGSIVQKGSLKIAISTNGTSPTMAKRLRETLSDTLPAQMEEVLQNLHRIRKQLKGDFSNKVKKLNEITAVLAVPPASKESG